MHTHCYAVDGEGNIHVFHSQNGRTNWLGEMRPTDRNARSIERRDAERVLGRDTVRRMTKTRHPLHFKLHRPPASGPEHPERIA